MSTVDLESGTPITLEDGVGSLDLEGLGEVVPPPVPAPPEVPEWIEPGTLYGADYPDFFPCPTWEYSQQIENFNRRTGMDSGWARQRKQWPEETSLVDLQWIMPTDTFDNWSRWMTANGHDWFRIYLDQYGAGKVLYEVRLIGPISYQYRSHDTIIAEATGELGYGSPEFGPSEPPPPDPDPSMCVPVRITTDLPAEIEVAAGSPKTVSITVNGDATEPVQYQWFRDGVRIVGATESSFTFSPDAEDIEGGTVRVEVTNPCGEDESFTAYLFAGGYNCASFKTALYSEFPSADALVQFITPNRYQGSSVAEDWFFTNDGVKGPGNSGVVRVVGSSKYMNGTLYDACEAFLGINGASNPEALLLEFGTSGNPLVPGGRRSMIYAARTHPDNGWRSPLLSLAWGGRYNRDGVGQQLQPSMARVYAQDSYATTTKLRLNLGSDENNDAVNIYTAEAIKINDPMLIAFTAEVSNDHQLVSGSLCHTITAKLWINNTVVLNHTSWYRIGNNDWSFLNWEDYSGFIQTLDPNIANSDDFDIECLAFHQQDITQSQMDRLYDAFLRNFASFGGTGVASTYYGGRES